jgi:hypothetical protein
MSRVTVDFVGEDIKRAGDETDCSIRVMAGAATRHVANPPPEPFDRPRAEPAVRDRCDRLRDRAQPVHARSALTRGFLGQIPHHPGRLEESATRRRQRHDHPTAEPTARRACALVAERKIPTILRVESGAEISAD